MRIIQGLNWNSSGNKWLNNFFRYGDKAPRSFFARVFGIIWILIGLVIISTFTATITTVLTASSLSNEAKLYGTKVGALQNSEEFRLGVKRNADVKGEIYYINPLRSDRFLRINKNSK